MTARASLPGRPRYLAFLPDFLFVPDEIKTRYVVKAWLLALLPSMLLSVVMNWLMPHAEPPDIAVEGAWIFVLLVAIGPLLETLLMTPVLLLVNRFAGAGPAVLGNAILWGVLHSLSAPIWGLVVWWPFLIFSIAFLTWRPRGLGVAILLVSVIHGLQNGVAAALVLIVTAAGGAPAT